MTTARVEDVDGRVQRSLRTRTQVLDAFLALIEEGDLSPTAQRIADRSGASLRTVFHQFNDVDTIHELAGQRVLSQIKQRPPIPSYGPLNRRIDLYVDARVELLRSIHKVASAARLREPFSVMLRRNRDFFTELGDLEIRTVFARELTPLSAPTRDALVKAIALVSNWPAWYSLSEELKLAEQAATEVIRSSVRALLTSRRTFGARSEAS